MATEKARWTNEDDVLLCSAWLNAGTNPVIGVDQGIRIFWKRIEDYYNREKQPNQKARGDQAMQNHWHIVSKAVNKFVGCYDNILTRRESGLNDNDRKMRALVLYRQNEEASFKYLHCWEVLKDEEKWISHMEWMRESDSTKRSGRKRTNTLTSTNFSEYNNDASDNEEPQTLATPVRPIGRKATKAASTRKKNNGQNIVDLDKTENMSTFLTSIEELRKEKKEELEVRKQQHEDYKRHHEDKQRQHEDKMEMELMKIDVSKLNADQYKLYQRKLKSFLRDE